MCVEEKTFILTESQIQEIFERWYRDAKRDGVNEQAKPSDSTACFVEYAEEVLGS